MTFRGQIKILYISNYFCCYLGVLTALSHKIIPPSTEECLSIVHMPLSLIIAGITDTGRIRLAIPVPSSRWPRQNQPNAFLEVLCFMMLGRGLVFHFYIICVSLWFLVLSFHGIPMCVKMYLSKSICVSCIFSLVHFFSSVCFVLFYFLIIQTPIFSLMREKERAQV